MRFAYEYANENNILASFNQEKKYAGKKWFRNFCIRNNFSQRTPKKLSAARVKAMSEESTRDFFQNLRDMFEKYDFPDDCVFNMDETGISTVPSKMAKVVSLTGKKTVSKTVSTERGENVTIVVCVSPVGFPVSPAIIIPRQSHHSKFYKGAPTYTLELYNSSGYLTSDLFLIWLKHFVEKTRPSKDFPLILILDNHTSHRSLEAVSYCRENHVYMLILPPHCTHLLQPLDLVIFSPLKNLFSDLLKGISYC